MCLNFIYKLFLLCTDKIDRVRETAGKIFLEILYHENPKIPFIPYHEQLKELFPK